MTNAIALRVLGTGATGFGPGADGGRDGYFQGEAPYPSNTERWSGIWYIQSKFHAPHLSTDPQKWLLEQVRAELKAFEKSGTARRWPDIWIISTNIDPSGTPQTGAFDAARGLVAKARPSLASRFHIWGGHKIVDFLSQHLDIAERYGHFLTPGHILTELLQKAKEDRATTEQIIQSLVISAIEEQKYTKLEQAGSMADSRPGIHKLFVDLPFRSEPRNIEEDAIRTLVKASSQNHKSDQSIPNDEDWQAWINHPHRASIWFVKGGPGQGKSTIGQYFCQIQRAALILAEPNWAIPAETKKLAQEIKTEATKLTLWPTAPRIPIYIELRHYAQWFGERPSRKPRGILSYLAKSLALDIEQTVLVGTIRRALSSHAWFVAFDGLDEVPTDIKDDIAKEVKRVLRQGNQARRRSINRIIPRWMNASQDSSFRS